MKRMLLFVTVLITSGSLANAIFEDYGSRMTRDMTVRMNELDFNCLRHYIQRRFKAERCQSGLCKNGGVYCNYRHNLFLRGKCICMEGTSGYCCSVVAGCTDSLCGHNETAATCQYDVFEKSPECVCSTSDEKFDYTQKICRKSCEKDDDCLNGGKCTGHGKFKFCQCLPGTEGDLCSEVTECKKNNICGTSSEVICTYDSTQMQAICKCLDPSKQIDYKEKICKGPCKNDTDCDTGHKCIGDQISKFCECVPGKTVNFCYHVTDCSEPDSCGIGNDTTCEYYTVQRKGKCQCSNSSKQFNYREKICKEPCRDSDCENGGKCTGHGDSKFCECLPGTAGDMCSEVTDCNEADFCGKGNDTTCIYNSTRLEAMCQCLDSSKQFDYKEKVCKKPCQEGDCKNGANCTLSEGFAFCECLPGTAGDVCSEVLECKKDNFCGTHNDSICTYDSLLKEAICQCSNPNKQFDYKEKICKPPCEEGECKNGGNCNEFRGSKLCDCLPGTSGDYCSEIADCQIDDFCGSGNDSTCLYDSVRMKAVCQCSNIRKEFNYKEKVCKEACYDTECENGGNCTADRDFKFCECLPGTTGDYCSEITECKKDNVCVADKHATCAFDIIQVKAFCRCLNPIKKFDYKEKICKEPCQEGECKNGGNCTEHGDLKVCECLPGTTGDFCSEITKCKSKNFCGIDEDSMCTYDTLRMEATCQCSYSSKQFDYEKKTCKEPCQENDCQNGGNCTGHGDFKFCECLPGTAGDHCSEITKCKGKKYCGTDKYSTCTYDTLRMKSVCRCLYPRKQFDNKKEICRAPCQEGDCKNGGNCTEHGDFKFCECPPGTTGDRCSEIMKCRKGNFCGKDKDSTCTYDTARMEAICRCSNPSKQFDYEKKICKEPCEEGDCKNGGNCTKRGDFKFCECPLGTTGDHCSEITKCRKENFCGNDKDSTCTYDTARMEAICRCSNPSKQFDYEKKICKEPCQESDCKNGGNCTGHGDFKFCECLRGIRGDYCSEIMECKQDNFCGTNDDVKCTYDRLRMEAICQCSNSSKQFDYKDKICKVPCGAEKCENGGFCKGTQDFKFCECLPGTTGDFCTEIPACRDKALCGYGSDVRCVYEKFKQEAACECLNSNTDFNYLTKTCQCDCGHNGTCALDAAGEKECSCNEGFAQFSGWCSECSCGRGGNCSFDSYRRKICACNTGFRDLHGNCERILLGESKESTFPALIGSLFAFLILAFSGLFYLRWRKQKMGLSFHFKKLKETVGEEYEQKVYLK